MSTLLPPSAVRLSVYDKRLIAIQLQRQEIVEKGFHHCITDPGMIDPHVGESRPHRIGPRFHDFSLHRLRFLPEEGDIQMVRLSLQRLRRQLHLMGFQQFHSIDATRSSNDRVYRRFLRMIWTDVEVLVCQTCKWTVCR